MNSTKLKQVEPIPEEWKPNKVGQVILCLLRSFGTCVGYSVIGMLITACILYNEMGSDTGMKLGLGMTGILMGSLFGCWLPAMFYWIAEKRKWAMRAGAACIALLNSFAIFPGAINAIKSLG